MTILILGLDGLDYHRVQANDYLSDFDVQHLEQDLDGANALFTRRVWPNIFAGTTDGAATDPLTEFVPDDPYLWERYPSRVLLPPVPNTHDHDNGNALPDRYVESFAPRELIQRTLNGLREDIVAALDNPGIRVIVACTRLPDIVGHKLPDEAGRVHDMVDEWVTNLPFPDDYLIVSDHGFGEFGTEGIAGHTTDAILASNFCEYDTMTEFCENWHGDLDRVVREDQLDALGYT